MEVVKERRGSVYGPWARVASSRGGVYSKECRKLDV